MKMSSNDTRLPSSSSLLPGEYKRSWMGRENLARGLRIPARRLRTSYRVAQWNCTLYMDYSHANWSVTLYAWIWQLRVGAQWGACRKMWCASFRATGAVVYTPALFASNGVFSRRYVRCDEGPNNKKLSAIHMHKLAYSRLQGAWLPSESQPDLT